MFFRIVNASYKKKEYLYLRLLESRREGKKIKHSQLVNLTESVQLRSDRVKPLFEDLNQTLEFLKTVNELAPPWCRYLKASYVMAMENAFKIEQCCREQDFRRILLQDWKRKQNKIFNENIFRELIQKESLNHGESGIVLCWLENLNIFVFDGNGFPLRVIQSEGANGEETEEVLLKLEIRKKEVIFLGRACELLYNNFRNVALKKNGSYSIKEAFVYKQFTDWSGKASLSFDKVIIMGTELTLKDEQVNNALIEISGFRQHVDYVNRRTSQINGGISMPEQDLNCTYFISYLFKKIFDDIRKMHKV